MATMRVNKTSDYTVMSNYHFREKEMSLKSKGLLSLMLSLPDDWDYSILGLVALSKDGKDSVMSSLDELERFGYLKRTKVIDNKGRFAGFDYDIYEQPQRENPYAENPNTDKPNAENQPQLNTKKLSTKETNTNNSKKERKKEANAKQKDTKKSFDDIIDSYTTNPELRKELKEHLRTKKSKNAPLTNRTIELGLKELDRIAKTDRQKIKVVQKAIMRGWTSFFPLKHDDIYEPDYMKNFYDAEDLKFNPFDDD